MNQVYLACISGSTISFCITHRSNFLINLSSLAPPVLLLLLIKALKSPLPRHSRNQCTVLVCSIQSRSLSLRIHKRAIQPSQKLFKVTNYHLKLTRRKSCACPVSFAQTQLFSKEKQLPLPHLEPVGGCSPIF